MTALSFTVTDAGRAEIINANNTGTGPVTITHIALGSGQYPPAKAQTSLQQEFKRLSVFGGEVVADDVIHVTITDDGPDQYTLGEFGLISDKGTLIALYAQTTPILEKNAEGIVLLSADMTLTSIDANSITFGPAEFVYPPASLTRAGVVVLSNAVNSTSQTQAATPQAVKTVNDALENHKAAGSAHTKAQVGLGLLQNWTYSHSYTGGSASKYATEKAVTDSHVYLKGYTDTAIANLVASSPAALDTLNELAAALGDDPNFATTMTNELAKKLNASSYTAADVLAKLKTVDGASSGLDADLLDGQHGTYYRAWANLTGVPATASRWPEIGEISNLSLELQRAQGLNVGGSAVDPNTTSDHVILSNHANTPGLGVYWHITTTFYSSKSSGANRAQLAIQYNGSSPCKVFARSCYNNTWLPWVRCDNGEYTAVDVLAKLKTVDGTGSGLDADLFDGVQRADMEATLKAYTDTKVAGLVDAAPGTLDTLNELAAALGDDPNFATTMTNELAKKLNAASYTAADVLAKLLTMHGHGSGLDADTVDSIHGSQILRNDQSGTITGTLYLTDEETFLRRGNPGQIILGGTTAYLQVGASYYKLLHDGNKATEAESIAGTVNKFPDAAGVAAYFNATEQQLGVNQSWQDVVASRAKGVTYTNTTGKPIVVAITGYGATNNDVVLYVDDVRVAVSDTASGTINAESFVTAVIPVGSTYSCTAYSGLRHWVELR